MCCMHFSGGKIMIEFGPATQAISYAWQGDGTTSQCWCQRLGKDWSWLKLQVEGACENSGDHLAESMNSWAAWNWNSVCTSSGISYWRRWRHNKPPVPHNDTDPNLCPGWEGRRVLNPCLSFQGLKLSVEGGLVGCTMSLYFAHPLLNFY